MTGPTSYIPREGDVFEAVVVGCCKAAVGGPFICKSVRSDKIVAVDTGGYMRFFLRRDFVFRKDGKDAQPGKS